MCKTRNGSVHLYGMVNSKTQAGITPGVNAFGDRAVRNDSDSEDSMGFTVDSHCNSCQMRLPSTGFLLEIAKCACPGITP